MNYVRDNLWSFLYGNYANISENPKGALIICEVEITAGGISILDVCGPIRD